MSNAAAPRPAVSQESYNSVVRENIDEFGMSPEEAIEDAVKQLEAQGVGLGLIVRDLPLYPEGQHPLVLAANAVLAAPADDNSQATVDKIGVLSAQLSTGGLSQRVLAARMGLAAALLRLAEPSVSVDKAETAAFRRCAALRALRRLLKQQSDALDSGQLLALLERARSLAGCDEAEGTQVEEEDAEQEESGGEKAAGDGTNQAEDSKVAAELTALLGVLGSACVLNEANRQLLAGHNIAFLLSGLLRPARSSHEPLVRQVCRLLRLLTLDDDVRAVVGQAHERARQVMSETPALSRLLRLCQAFSGRPESRGTVSRVFDTLACLAVRDEFCQRALELGSCEFIVGAVCAEGQEARFAASGMGLLRNLARNDDVKRAAATYLPELIQVAAKFAKQAQVAHQFLGLATNLCLRQPATGRRFAELGGPQLLAQLGALHRSDALLMRQLCGCVRTAATRDDSEESGGCVRPAMLEQGMEPLLNQLLPVCEDEAKGALLALGCEVKFKPMLWTGRNGQLPRD